MATIGLTTAFRSYPLYLVGTTLVKYLLCINDSLGYINIMLMSTTYEAIWFKNKETAIAMTADSLSEVVFGATVFFANPYIYDRARSLATCYSIISVFCVFSVCCALMLAYIDKYAPVYVNANEEKDEETYKGFSLRIFKDLGYPFWLLVLGHIGTEGTNSLLVNVICALFLARFGLDSKTTGPIIGIIPPFAGIASAPISIVLYKYGYKGHIGILCIE